MFLITKFTCNSLSLMQDIKIVNIVISKDKLVWFLPQKWILVPIQEAMSNQNDVKEQNFSVLRVTLVFASSIGMMLSNVAKKKKVVPIGRIMLLHLKSIVLKVMQSNDNLLTFVRKLKLLNKVANYNH